MTAPEREAQNARVQARWDELSREGKHGHYETLFQVVREEVERSAAPAPATCDHDYRDQGNHYACKFCGHSIAGLPEADAARNTAPAVTVTEGWKLVPIEPTPEMLAATLPTSAAALGMNGPDWALVERALALIEPPTISNGDHLLGVNAGIELLRDYRAMLAAVPTTPQTGSQE